MKTRKFWKQRYNRYSHPSPLQTVTMGLTGVNPENLRQAYQQAIAQNMVNEKFAIMHLLRQSGILGLYTSPGNLTVDVISKYLELKSRRMI